MFSKYLSYKLYLKQQVLEVRQIRPTNLDIISPHNLLPYQYTSFQYDSF